MNESGIPLDRKACDDLNLLRHIFVGAILQNLLEAIQTEKFGQNSSIVVARGYQAIYYVQQDTLVTLEVTRENSLKTCTSVPNTVASLIRAKEFFSVSKLVSINQENCSVGLSTSQCEYSKLLDVHAGNEDPSGDYVTIDKVPALSYTKSHHDNIIRCVDLISKVLSVVERSLLDTFAPRVGVLIGMLSGRVKKYRVDEKKRTAVLKYEHNSILVLTDLAHLNMSYMEKIRLISNVSFDDSTKTLTWITVTNFSSVMPEMRTETLKLNQGVFNMLLQNDNCTDEVLKHNVERELISSLHMVTLSFSNVVNYLYGELVGVIVPHSKKFMRKFTSQHNATIVSFHVLTTENKSPTINVIDCDTINDVLFCSETRGILFGVCAGKLNVTKCPDEPHFSPDDHSEIETFYSKDQFGNDLENFDGASLKNDFYVCFLNNSDLTISVTSLQINLIGLFRTSYIQMSTDEGLQFSISSSSPTKILLDIAVVNEGTHSREVAVEMQGLRLSQYIPKNPNATIIHWLLLLVQPSNELEILKEVFHHDNSLSLKSNEHLDRRMKDKNCRNKQTCTVAKFLSRIVWGNLGPSFWAMASDSRLKFHFPALQTIDRFLYFTKNSSITLQSIVIPMLVMSSSFYILPGTTVPIFLLISRVYFPDYFNGNTIERFISNKSVLFIDSSDDTYNQTYTSGEQFDRFSILIDTLIRLFSDRESYLKIFVQMMNEDVYISRFVMRTLDYRLLSYINSRLKFSSTDNKQSPNVCMHNFPHAVCDKFFMLQKSADQKNNSVSVVLVTTNYAVIDQIDWVAVVLIGDGLKTLSMAARTMFSFVGNATHGQANCTGKQCVLDLRYYRRNVDQQITILVKRKHIRIFHPGSRFFELNNATHIYDRLHMPDVVYVSRAIEFLHISSTFPHKDVVHVSSRFKGSYLKMSLTGPKSVKNRARKGLFQYNVRLDMNTDSDFELTGSSRHVIVLDEDTKNVSISHLDTYDNASLFLLRDSRTSHGIRVRKDIDTVCEIVSGQQKLVISGTVAILTNIQENCIDKMQVSLPSYHFVTIRPDNINTDFETETTISNPNDILVFSNSLTKSMSIIIPDTESHVVLRSHVIDDQSGSMKPLPPLYLRKNPHGNTSTVIYFKNLLYQAETVCKKPVSLEIYRLGLYNVVLDLSVTHDDESLLIVVLENVVPSERVPYVIFAEHPMHISCQFEQRCQMVPAPIHVGAQVEVVIFADPHVARNTPVYIDNNVESTVQLIRDRSNSLAVLSAGDALVTVILLDFYESDVLKTIKLHFINWTVDLQNL